MLALHEILPQFKKENKLQKVQCVVLSDGEAAPLKYHREFHRHWEHEPFIGTSTIHPNAFLRDRKTGNTYSLDCEWWYEFTDILLRNLRDKFTDVNFIGIRVLEPRDANSFIRRYTGWGGKNFDRFKRFGRKRGHFPFINLDITHTLVCLVLLCLVILSLMLMRVQANQKSNLPLLKV